MIEEEELQFHEEYMIEQDSGILHFLLASGVMYVCHIYESWHCVFLFVFCFLNNQ